MMAAGVHGWVVLDKQAGMTSSAAVQKIRHLFAGDGKQRPKAGHAGTLDPDATGILPIALGEATKTIPFVTDADKEYAFTLAWGAETNTDDAAGEVVRESAMRPDTESVKAALGAMRGEILQTPPDYSAIKQGGRRAYALARKGEAVAIPPRRVIIHALELIENNTESARLTATTGKGVYIRAIARDLGRALGSAAHITELRRTRVGIFTESMAISLDFSESLRHIPPELNKALNKALLPVMTALDDIPALAISGVDAARLRRGQKIAPVGQAAGETPIAVATLGAGGLPVAIITIRGGVAEPKRVFNLAP